MRTLTSTLVAACLFALFGCDEAGKEKTTPTGGNSSWPSTQTTDGGSFDVTVQPEGGEIVRNKHFTVSVKLAAKSGGAAGATVVVDADMPAHGHGMNTKPETSAIDDGSFRTEGMLLHMGGDWIITVDVTSAGKTERATFPVLVE